MGNGVVGLGGDTKKVVRSDVHNEELPVFEAKPIGTGGDRGVPDFEFDLGDEQALIFLLDIGGIARRINERREDKAAFLVAEPDRIAHLYGRALAAEKI